MTIPFSLPALSPKHRWILLFSAGYGLLAAIGLRSYLPAFSLQLLLGILTMMVCAGKPSGKPTHRLDLAVILLAILYLLLPAKTFLFIALAVGLLYLVESLAGRLQLLCLAALALVSPIFDYACTVFSFPIRLFLTQLAGRLMQPVFPSLVVEGNMLVRDGASFAVDPACMGLHMLTSSLLAVLLLTAIYRQQYQRQLPVRWIAVLLGSSFLLNIVSNLLRIICLVTFSVGADSPLHSCIGMGFFLLYGLLPACWLVKRLTKTKGKPLTTAAPEPAAASVPIHPLALARNITLLALLAFVTLQGQNREPGMDMDLQAASIEGYNSTPMKHHILKLENEAALIYVKPIAGFYASDHQPMICWTGSGYQFRQVKASGRDGHTIYTAVLEKGKDKLYSAWWYETDNGQTISQLDWRWQALSQGKQFALVNITSNSPDTLLEETRKLFRLKLVHTLMEKESHLIN
ncbi:MAG: exosortase N [Candidatus Pseudobacter hemicellulosilyticus]|uniref:Exosortase N n=1 Tax=Candidatus Pseudobacter hemicellulosilyticus TaxID=3121375 RepID=A0AAJ5WPS5_9BACT|nr:MAG: exosortase N [Pseudobacter sp.]